MKYLATIGLACIACFLCACPVSPGGLYGGNDNSNPNGNTNSNTNENTSGEAVNFAAQLTGDQETDATNTGATGAGTFLLNEGHTALTFSVTATGLSGSVIGAHFHRGAPGMDGTVVFDLTNLVQESDGNVSIDGTWMIAGENLTALLQGNIYVNIHTQQHQAGEIRGQLEVQQQ